MFYCMILPLLGEPMRRRKFIGALGGAVAFCPLGGIAQQPKMPTIGVLVVGSAASDRSWQLFRQDLRDLGYVDGQSVRFAFRSDLGQVSRLPELASELVRLKVDLIVAWFTPAARAAKQATRDIPIVMVLVGDPVATGLVESLSRPGGNVTGVAAAGAELAGKCVDLIRELLPSVHRVAALANLPDPFSRPFIEQVQLAGKATGTTIDPVMINNATELDAAFSAMERDRVNAAIIQPSLPTKLVAALALTHRIPAVSFVRSVAEEGGLMSYAPDETDAYQRAAIFVEKILKGAKPADLPVEQPTRFELVINLKTAKALGLTVPPMLLAQAQEVIE
jgi:putative tryptophan/tyrosine transport system substrate-binding protein